MRWRPTGRQKPPITRLFREADDGTRTHDTWLGKPVLYQLSYVREILDSSFALTRPSQTRGTVSGVCALAAVLALTFVVASAGAVSAPAAKQADATVFGGLGTWVDIYDGRVFRSPERTASLMAARGIETVWVETANYNARTDVVRPKELGRLVDALHARGIRAVAWYLPGHLKHTLDVRRGLAMLSFQTASGGTFDGIALNIEGTSLRNASVRSQHAVALTRAVRTVSGEMPLAIVPIDPRALERRPSRWPRFPWAGLAKEVDAIAPMIYTGSSFRGFEATYGYVTRSLRLVRKLTRNPDVPIHVAGGVADRMGGEELAGFVAAVEDDGATIGVSLYDWDTMTSTAWRAIARLKSS
jgi:hypothetical protein